VIGIVGQMVNRSCGQSLGAAGVMVGRASILLVVAQNRTREPSTDLVSDTLAGMRLQLLGFVTLCACYPATSSRPQSTAESSGPAAVEPDACGRLDTSATARKVYAFLVASSELDRSSRELEGSVHHACEAMALQLGTPSSGETSELCRRVRDELDADLKISISSQSRLVTRYVPPVCRTDLDVTAGFVAECEGRARADVSMQCHGRCEGTCSGTCSSGAGPGGRCDGTCDGGCRGSCEGSADVDASAECRASAEVHATTHTTCTEAKVEVVRQDVTVIDTSKFDRAASAITAGLPALLVASRRLELAGAALGQWVSTGATLAESAAGLVAELGEKSLCVAGQLAAVASASASIQARVSVSVEASASLSASAGATAR
jgi:hypothetical protein